MSLDLSPPELTFRRPFTSEVTQTITLTNATTEPIAFKVKTTAPKRYCVRPNSGRIEPDQHVEVQVVLQAMKEDPPLDQKCRDKFLVQSVAVPADKEFSHVAAIWQDVDSRKGSVQVFERKIKVAFLPEKGAEPALAPHEEPPAYSAVSPKEATTYSTPARAPAPASERPPVPARTDKELPDQPSPSSAHSARHSFSSHRESGQAQTQPDAVALKAQLNDALEQISRLKDQLADQGLRQRKIPTDEKEGEKEKNGAESALPVPQGEQGVPLNVVAVLCFVSFLLAYLFF